MARRHWLVLLVIVIIFAATYAGWHLSAQKVRATKANSQDSAIVAVMPRSDLRAPKRATNIPDPWPNGQSPKAPPPGQTDSRSASDDRPGRSRAVEESGPDLSGSTADELVDMLAGGTQEKWADVRAAWELGNRSIFQSWKPDVSQQARIDATVEKSLDEKLTAAVDGYATTRGQLYRLWSLAHPALIRALEPARSNHDLIIKTLAATRTRELIETLVAQYRNEPDPERKRLLAFTLSCMKEQRRVLTPKRQVMCIAESEAIYSEVIAPALGGGR